MKVQWTMYYLIVAFIILCGKIYAQNDIPIGTWRDHLSYSNAVAVTEGNGIIYCATDLAVFSYNTSDKSIERLNLISGLSDIGVETIKFNTYNNKLLIAYSNGNLDIINQNKKITNLSFIKNSNIIAEKVINHIYLMGKYAYLSTGFGVVLIDMDKEEILDTYLFGPLGSYVNTNAVTIDNQYIYAASSQGVYFASKNSLNLADYSAWALLPSLGSKNYSDIVTFEGSLIVAQENTPWSSDTIYYNQGGGWQKLISYGVQFQNFSTSSGKLIVSLYGNALFFTSAFIEENNYYSFDSESLISPSDVIIRNNGEVWMADRQLGLLHFFNEWNGEKITPEGPFSSNSFRMDLVDEDLWVVGGGYGASDLAGLYLTNHLINYRVNNKWNSVGKTISNINGGTTFDAVRVAINPSNKNQVFVGTWNDGLFELNNGVVSNIYTAQNSTLDSTFYGSTKIGALKFDDNNNLWICSSSKQINVITPSQQMYSSLFKNISNNGGFTNLVIDNNNNKWVVLENTNSIIVFNENGTFDDSSDDRSVLLNASNNGIPGTRLASIANDLDGNIWLGTDAGVGLINNPGGVVDQSIAVNPVYIQQDGQTQLLLETETVTAIAIDGANRKWFGTENSGVYLMSEDGSEEILHFTTKNSPLFADNIFDIKINGKTGEVYIATEKGLISYKGTATDAQDDFSNVFVYPNPVREDYHGVIAIRGLVEDTDVRITDISGNLVSQTKSLGGQAIWDGKDLHGNRVQTGVYMVFNASQDGQLKQAAKILFIH